MALATGELSVGQRDSQFARLRDAQSRVLNLTYWADFLNVVRAAGCHHHLSDGTFDGMFTRQTSEH